MTALDEHRLLVDGAGAYAAEGLGQFEATAPMPGRSSTDRHRRHLALPAGRYAHALLLRDDATILERVTVYRFPDRVMLLADGANRDAAWEHIVARKRGSVRLRDISSDVGLIAVRGPTSIARLELVLQPLPPEPGDVVNARLGEVDVFAARATRDGPEGIDLFCRQRDRHTLLELLRSIAVLPIGESAWNLLHMEWGIPHVGRGIDRGDTPIEAGLEYLVAEGRPHHFRRERARGARRAAR